MGENHQGTTIEIVEHIDEIEKRTIFVRWLCINNLTGWQSLESQQFSLLSLFSSDGSGTFPCPVLHVGRSRGRTALPTASYFLDLLLCLLSETSLSPLFGSRQHNFWTVNLHSCLNELPFQYFSYNLKRKTAVDTSLPPVIWKYSIHNSYLENCRMKVRGLAATTVWNKLMLLWNIFGVNYFLKLVDTKFAFFRIPHFWPYHTRDI